MDRFCLLLLAGVLAGSPFAQTPVAEGDQLPIGVQPDGRIVVPTNQVLKPAGQQVTFAGRPVALAWFDAGKTLAVMSMKGLIFLDAATGKIRQTLASPVGLSVVGLVAQGDRLFVSD